MQEVIQVFFIGSTNQRGTYYFYSQQHNGWVVADIETGKASLHNKLALIRVVDELDITDALEDRVGLGQDGSCWLVDGEELVPLLRVYADQFEPLTVYQQNGTNKPDAKDEQTIADFARRAEKEIG